MSQALSPLSPENSQSLSLAPVGLNTATQLTQLHEGQAQPAEVLQCLLWCKAEGNIEGFFHLRKGCQKSSSYSAEQWHQQRQGYGCLSCRPPHYAKNVCLVASGTWKAVLVVLLSPANLSRLQVRCSCGGLVCRFLCLELECFQTQTKSLLELQILLQNGEGMWVYS